MDTRRYRFAGALAAGAGDVFVLDFGGALDGVAGDVVGVPGDGFGGDFRVFAEELERVDRGGGIVFLVGEFGRLEGGLLLEAETTIKDGELVVRAEVVGVDLLNLLVCLAGGLVVVLLVVGEA